MSKQAIQDLLDGMVLVEPAEVQKPFTLSQPFHTGQEYATWMIYRVLKRLDALYPHMNVKRNREDLSQEAWINLYDVLASWFAKNGCGAPENTSAARRLIARSASFAVYRAVFARRGEPHVENYGLDAPNELFAELLEADEKTVAEEQLCLLTLMVPERLQFPAVLWAIRQLSQKEIAQLMNVSTKMVQRMFEEIRQHLQCRIPRKSPNRFSRHEKPIQSVRFPKTWFAGAPIGKRRPDCNMLAARDRADGSGIRKGIVKTSPRISQDAFTRPAMVDPVVLPQWDTDADENSIHEVWRRMIGRLYA